MTDFNDIINKRFGMLVVIEYVGNYKYRCKCDCGNESTVNRYNLLNGRSSSCGCKQYFPKPRINTNRLNKTVSICEFCHQRPVYAKGLCLACYTRAKRNGGSPEYKVRDTIKQKQIKAEKKKAEKLKAYKPTTERGKEVLKLRKQGLSTADIAKQYGVTRQCVQIWLKK